MWWFESKKCEGPGMHLLTLMTILLMYLQGPFVQLIKLINAAPFGAIVTRFANEWQQKPETQYAVYDIYKRF